MHTQQTLHHHQDKPNEGVVVAVFLEVIIIYQTQDVVLVASFLYYERADIVCLVEYVKSLLFGFSQTEEALECSVVEIAHKRVSRKNLFISVRT